MRNVLVLSTMLFGATIAHAEPAPNTITVAGDADIEVSPDYARVDLGVVTTAKTVVTAAQDNAGAMRRLVDTLAKMGISDRNIQTSRYNVEAMHPRLATGQEDETRTSGYSVTNKVTVTTAAIENLAKIIDAATAAGSNSIQSVAFGIKNRAKAEDEAKAEAVKNARHQAEVAAAAEGAKVGKVIAIIVGHPAYNNDMETVTVTSSRLNSTPILPGAVRVSASVTVQFALQ